MASLKFSELTITSRNNFVRRLAWCTPWTEATWRAVVQEVDPVLHGNANNWKLGPMDFATIVQTIIKRLQ